MSDRSRAGEVWVFSLALLSLELVYLSPALRPGRVLSPADLLLVGQAFQRPGAGEYEPANRLLTDVVFAMEPWARQVSRQWRAGRVPLWSSLAGCGVPLLANPQAAALSPVNLFIYYLLDTPSSWLLVGLVKLWVAGLGTFLLARQLGLGGWGRWFAGLTFPFSGFMVVWLLYPLTGVAMWLPLLLWSVGRLHGGPLRTRKVATTAVLVALSLLGGHPETAGHCLLVAAAFGLWCSRRARGELAEAVGRPAGRAGLAGIGAAYVLGGLVAAAQLAPFAEYLARSQAWPERARRVPPAWRFRSPAIQNTPALALPYVYGSYRRGHPHVEKFIGAGNFNEIAGGYTGLMTLVVLVPLGCTARRRHCWLRFFIVLDLAALAVAYRLPLVDNLVRAVPLLRVTSNERLLLMVALCHCLLGGAALDNLPVLGRPSGGRLGRVVCAVLVAGAAVLLVAAAVVGVSGDWLSRQARGHYAAEAAARGLPPDALQSRAARMAARTVRFFPRYYALSALYCLGLAGGVWLIGRWYRGQWAGGDGQGGGVRMDGYPSPSALVAGVALAITVVDLFWFGFGYNPAIGRRRYFPTCPTLAYLAGQAGPFRVLPLDEEFPPNLLAAYGLADVRNYDALELRSVLRYFRPLWPPRSGKPLTSNCWTPWPRVAANLDRLRAANVRYMISATEAPPGLQGVRLVHRSGTVRLYELPGARLISGIGDGGGRLLPVPATMVRYGDGRIEADVTVPAGLDRLVVAESFMPGWTASVDGRPAAVSAWRGAFLELAVPAGRHRVVLEYRPGSFRLGLALSVVGLAALVGLACLRGRERV